jgi:hypothetical protein
VNFITLPEWGVTSLAPLSKESSELSVKSVLISNKISGAEGGD